MKMTKTKDLKKPKKTDIKLHTRSSIENKASQTGWPCQ
jgi:hypothetical protein